MPDFLNQASLSGRIAELEERSRSSNARYPEVATHLPEDLRARAAALATILGLNALGAIQEGATVQQLEQEREAARQLTVQVEREAREAGLPQPSTVDED
jgi:hypothetical protein